MAAEEIDFIKDINDTVLKSKIHVVEIEYEKVLDIVSKRLEREDCRKILLDILCAAGGAFDIDYHVYYNSLRVILEWMFRASRKNGLLHDRCFDRKDHINLTDASMFMAGLPALHSGVICRKAHFPRFISKHVKFILRITGDASHTTVIDTDENPSLSAYWAEINTPYLLYSLTYMLCDVLIWFDQYLEANPDVAANKALWRKLVFTGPLSQDSDGNYFAGDCLLNYKSTSRNVESGLWRLGDMITVSDSTYNTDESIPYCLVARRFKKKDI